MTLYKIRNTLFDGYSVNKTLFDTRRSASARGAGARAPRGELVAEGAVLGAHGSGTCMERGDAAVAPARILENVFNDVHHLMAHHLMVHHLMVRHLMVRHLMVRYI